MPSKTASMRKLKIAMTGATGFVGSHIVRGLAGRGHDLSVLVRDANKLKSDFPATARLISGSLTDQVALAELTQSADVVLHVAGAISAVDEAGFRAVNVDGTRAVVEAARKAGVKRLVHVSSLAAREPSLSYYCASKAEGEAVVRKIDAGMEWIIIRPPAVYGPGDRATLPLIQQLSRRHALLTGTRRQRISVLHVDDLAAALVCAAEGDVAPGNIYEADDGTPGGYGWQDLATAAGASLGFVPRVYLLPAWLVKSAGTLSGAMARMTHKAAILSSGKARELYHPDWVIRGMRLDDTGAWTAKINFENGFAGTLEWYRQKGWLPDVQDPPTKRRIVGGDSKDDGR